MPKGWLYQRTHRRRVWRVHLLEDGCFWGKRIRWGTLGEGRVEFLWECAMRKLGWMVLGAAGLGMMGCAATKEDGADEGGGA